MYQGSCLCKKVRFQITGNFAKFFLCHCSRCRKGSGSAHGANLFSDTAQLQWLAGQDHAKSFRLADTRFARTFCDTCGAALPTLNEIGLVVPAGCLDGDVGMKPSAHIHVGSRADWDHELERIAAFEALPTR